MMIFAYADLSPALHGETDRKTIAGVQHVEAYRLLADLYRIVYQKDLPALRRAEGGKPYLCGRDVPFFSVSHEGCVVGVFLSSSHEAGLDINRTTRAANERACRRFLGAMRESDRLMPEDVTFYRAAYREGRRYVPTPFSPVFSEEEGAATRFSRAEACLKLSGGGFADLSRLAEISARAQVLSFFLPPPLSSYTVSLAVDPTAKTPRVTDL